MKFIIPTSIADKVEPQLREIAPAAEVVHVDQDGAGDGDLSDAEVLLRWWMPPTTLRRIVAAAPRLRWLHTPSAGVDGLLIPEVLDHKIVLTNSAGAHAIPIAEFVLLSLLSHAKHASDLAALTPEQAWARGRTLQLGELYEKTLVILGLGHIGQEIARRAAAFGMRVLGSRRRPAPIAGVERVVGDDAWRALLPEADYLVLATPLTSATKGMIDAAALAQLRPSAYLVNIARGEIIDTDALIAALEQGRLAGAALDVVPEEPLPAEHPLWRTPNVWITPHISSSSPRTSERAIAIFLENVRRDIAGQPFINLVDLQAGY
ncbi:MAG: D-2-hydroxyacid dehydrogenase [Roseiflexaceae bacterium]